MKKEYVVRNVYRSFVLTGILTALTTTLGMLIDNIIVGQCLGANALGAMSIISPISLVLSAFGNICSGGGTARAAQAIGKGQQHRVNGIFTATLLFIVFFGGMITVLGLAFTPRIARILGAQGALMNPTVDYMRGYFLGAIPTIMTTAIMGFVKIDGSTRLPLACIAVMTSVNIALDLIFTLVFNMGMFGMALATSISYLCAMLAACSHFFKKYATLRPVRPDGVLREIFSMTRTGAPTALSRICDTVKIMVLNNLLVGIAGAGAVAALNIRTQASNLLLALVLGVSQAIVPVAGMFFGEEDRSALRSTFKEALRLGLLLSSAVALILLIFAESFGALLGVRDGDILRMSAAALRMLAFSLPLLLVNMAMISFYQSTGKAGFATMICVLDSLVYILGFALLLVHPMGISGVWTAFLLCEIFTLGTSILRISLRKHSLPRSFDDLLCLPDDFGGRAEDRLEISIDYDIAQVVDASRSVYDFGLAHGLEPALLNKAALIIEEMAGNVVKHSPAQRSNASLDVLVLNREDSLLVRIRDNGFRFDPAAYLKENHHAEDQFGLRIIGGLADQFDYRYSIGLNNLKIVLSKQERKKQSFEEDRNCEKPV